MERDKYQQKEFPSICIFTGNLDFRELTVDQSHLTNKQIDRTGII